MAGSTHESTSCSCGQVVFDVTGCRAGEKLTCPWCAREYRYLGGDKIEPWGGTPFVVAPSGAPGALTGTLRTPGPAPRAPKARVKIRRREIPGGALRMVGFIVVCNAIALILLQVFFVRQSNGSRTTPWGDIIPRSRVPWPELVTLAIGHLCSFVAWACYVFLLHIGQKTKAPEQVVKLDGKKDAKRNET